MDIKKIFEKMTFEQKAILLTGFEGTSRPIPELGIERVYMVDGPHGVRKSDPNTKGGCVCFPTSSAVGSSWSREVARKTGQAIGRECRQEDYEMLLAPGVNMKRTPYCGRNFEYFSEDPVLSGHLAAEFVNGLEDEGIGASVKHYAVNNQEYKRTTNNSEVDERTLREYYLKAFEITLKNSNPTSVMCAYNKLGGIWCSENKYLLTDILRGEWGYDGLVVSDWGAVYNACRAVRAGLDLDMPCNRNIVKDLQRGIENGDVTMEEIDNAVMRMLKFIDRTKRMQKPKGEYSREAQHKIAHDAAVECITLLKNDDNVLPITGKKYKKIGVFGEAARRPMIMGGGSSHILLDNDVIDKPIDFIQKLAAEENIEVHFDPVTGTFFKDRLEGFMGAEDVGPLNNLSSSEDNDFDAMVVFISDNYGMDVETEHWDRENITYANYINGMVESACNACENVIVVMQTGCATLPGRWHKNVKGVIQMWYAGEAGGSAVADILFGRVNPSAKLSESFAMHDRAEVDPFGDGYKTWYKEGMYVGYRYYDNHPEEVWFPFGHGLSYTTFEYSDLRLEHDGEAITVTAKIKNTGECAGKEIVQLYVSHKNSIVLMPEKELKAFDKIYLEPGEEKEVRFELCEKDLAYYNICLRQWHTESGVYEFMVGASSADIRLRARCDISTKGDYTIDAVPTKLVMQES